MDSQFRYYDRIPISYREWLCKCVERTKLSKIEASAGGGGKAGAGGKGGIAG